MADGAPPTGVEQANSDLVIAAALRLHPGLAAKWSMKAATSASSLPRALAPDLDSPAAALASIWPEELTHPVAPEVVTGVDEVVEQEGPLLRSLLLARLPGG